MISASALVVKLDDPAGVGEIVVCEERDLGSGLG
jgi:hypothetical protein